MKRLITIHWLVFSLIIISNAFGQGPNESGHPVFSFRIIFGIKDTTASAWNGEIIAGSTQIIKIEADQFRNHQYEAKGWSPQGITSIKLGDPAFPNDYLTDSVSWICSTRKSPVHGPTTEWHDHGQINSLHAHEILTPVILHPSIIVNIMGGQIENTITVKTTGGNFNVSPFELLSKRTIFFLEGNVQVEMVPSVQPVTLVRPGQQDFPSMFTSRSGETWVCWQEYDNQSSDNVMISRQTGSGWSLPFQLAVKADAFHTALAEDGKGRIWAVWSAQVNGRFDLYARNFAHAKWSPVIKITQGSSTKNIYHRMAADATGNVWLTWQANTEKFSQIMVKKFDGTKWSEDFQVSSGNSSGGNNWWPAIAVAKNGNIAISWDGYASGNYDIYVRQFANKQWQPEKAIAASSRFEAHPTIAYDDQNRLWLAWDESGNNWGKDFGFLMQNKLNTQLYGSREVKVVCIQGNEILTTKQDLSTVLDPKGFWELPHLQMGADGKPWLLVRHLVMREPDTPLEGPIDLAMWEIYACQYTGNEWTKPEYLPHSSGRNDMMPATSLSKSGNLQAVWATDQRDAKSFQPHQLVINTGVFKKAPVTGSVNLVPYTPVAGSPFSQKQTVESEQVKKIRDYRIQHAGKTYRIFRGDLHRHTDISVDGNTDGSLLDAYRYARDAARLDFIGIADHTDDIWESYAWWRSQKVADVFQLSNNFAALYGYERSVEYPNGHRNIFFANRGAAGILPIGSFESRGYVGAGILYQYLHRFNGISIPHTVGRTSGTDWRDNDPKVEPVLELYQGDRDVYEYPGSPRPYHKYLLPDSTQPVPRASSAPKSPSFRPLGFAWHALSKDYKLGFIASSDHISTHISYACVIGENLSPKDLFDAIKARHTYAATDNIILDITYKGSGGNYLMGDIFESSKAVTIESTITGTGTIEQLDIIKDGAIVQTIKPGKQVVHYSYTDPQPGSKTKSYYYIRIIQENGEMAWGSPAWVTYKNAP